MASTRAATGNSRPRVFPKVEEPVAVRKRKTTKKTGAAKTKANTSKPRSKSGVTKAAPKKKPTVKKVVKGAMLKAEGVVTGKPGKKAAGTAEMRGKK